MISYVRLTLLLLCVSITRNEADNTEARAQTNKRHRIAMKQLILIMLVYVTSFVPLTVSANADSTTAWLSNNCIYLDVIREFRKEAKNMHGEHNDEEGETYSTNGISCAVIKR